MKNVFIKVEGIITICEYCSWSKYNSYKKDIYDDIDDIFDDDCYNVNGWQGIKGIYVHNPDNTNFIGEIGKVYTLSDYFPKDNKNYINEIGKVYTINDYFHKLFAPDSDHPLPIDLHVAHTNDFEKLIYVIEIEDDEEFDIKKVQLVYSHNEIAPLKDFVLAEKIMYDGNEVEVDDSHNEYSHFEIASVGVYEQYEIEEFMQ